MANIDALIAWKQKRYPRAKPVIFGPPPVQNNTYEAALVALRPAQAARVAALDDDTVLFLNQGAVFDRAVGNNYVTADGSDGTRIHPDDDGLLAIWNGGYGGVDGIKAWLDANLTRI